MAAVGSPKQEPVYRGSGAGWGLLERGLDFERALIPILGGVKAGTELTIADAARASGVSVHTLRYYERAGLIDGIERAASGHRRYGEADLAWVEVLRCLRATGMPIRQIRRYAELARAGEGTEPERLALLEEHRAAVRAELAEVRRHLAFIDRKIAIYEEKTR